jgi:hypothetical protein
MKDKLRLTILLSPAASRSAGWDAHARSVAVRVLVAHFYPGLPLPQGQSLTEAFLDLVIQLTKVEP